jgi:hypothetical protein
MDFLVQDNLWGSFAQSEWRHDCLCVYRSLPCSAEGRDLTIDEPVFQTRAKPNARMINDLGWRASAAGILRDIGADICNGATVLCVTVSVF